MKKRMARYLLTTALLLVLIIDGFPYAIPDPFTIYCPKSKENM